MSFLANVDIIRSVIHLNVSMNSHGSQEGSDNGKVLVHALLITTNNSHNALVRVPPETEITRADLFQVHNSSTSVVT